MRVLIKNALLSPFQLKSTTYVFIVKQVNIHETILTLRVRVRKITGLGGSVGCAYDWRSGVLGFEPLWVRLYSFVEIDNGRSLPSTDSRRAVVSFWQKNAHKSIG